MTTSKTIAGLIGPTLVAIAASMLLNIGSFPALLRKAGTSRRQGDAGWRIAGGVASQAVAGYGRGARSLGLQSAVDGRATDTQRLGNLRWPHAVRLELTHLGGID